MPSRTTARHAAGHPWDGDEEVRKLRKIICSHCEDVTLRGGDHIAAGSPYAIKLMIPGISNESEYLQLRRELALAEKTGCPTMSACESEASSS